MKQMAKVIRIRAFLPVDALPIRELFIRVNRLLAPPHLREVFEGYIERSLAEEIDVIQSYYSKSKGGFWVAVEDQEVVGMFGLEESGDNSMECAECTWISPIGAKVSLEAC